jgi:Domain of unknown function (DUF4365)
MTKLPKRTNSQMIGSNAADLLSSVLTVLCNVIPVPQDRDFGIDFICEIMQGEHPTGKLFNIQCKGKEEAKVKGDLIIVPIAVFIIKGFVHQNLNDFNACIVQD